MVGRNFHVWLRRLCGGGGWLDQVRIRLTQFLTELKVEAELGKNIRSFPQNL